MKGRVVEVEEADLLATARMQLAGEPFNTSRKRIARTGEDTGTMSLRMFRLDFRVDAAARGALNHGQTDRRGLTRTVGTGAVPSASAGVSVRG